MLRQDTRLGDVVSTIALQDGALITGSTQDCTPYAERAKAMQAAGQFGGSEMRLAASVPAVLVERYCNQAGIDMAEFNASQKHKKRLLNDPALAHFRIWPGRV